MKALFALVVSILAFSAVAAELDMDLLKAIGDDRTRWVAHSRGAEARECFRIVDNDGKPVTNASVRCAFKVGADASGLQDVYGVTDTNGLCTINGMCKAYMDYSVVKDGYYCSHGKVDYMETTRVPAVIDGKWQPYGEARTVVLKRIRTPISIGEFGLCSMPIPAYDEWVGFDFGKRMWTPPYGDGRFADVLLRFGRSLVDRQTDFKMTMDVSFTNNPHAGCYQLKYEKFSERKNVYHADGSAVYTSEMNYVQERHPGSPRNDNRIGWDSYLVFRTRTRVDEDGKLVSAHYGIIGGCWSFYGTMLSGGYLFNPTPNDTNLEDAETARLSRLGYKQRMDFERSRKVMP